MGANNRVSLIARLLAVFLFLQSNEGPVLDIPTKYLWLSLAPIIVALFAGGFITKFKTPFLEVNGDLNKLRYVTADNGPVSDPPQTNGDWRLSRAKEYERSNNLVLVHEYKPSEQKGQVFDIFIYLIRHEKNSTKPKRVGFEEVEKVEFYFGSAWGHQVYTVTAENNVMLGVRTHAYGTFLATCRITFKDPNKAPEIVYRYIDFEMAAKPKA